MKRKNTLFQLLNEVPKVTLNSTKEICAIIGKNEILVTQALIYMGTTNHTRHRYYLITQLSNPSI
jgi:hypothetical protein